jgi:hypothetical protein
MQRILALVPSMDKKVSTIDLITEELTEASIEVVQFSPFFLGKPSLNTRLAKKRAVIPGDC